MSDIQAGSILTEAECRARIEPLNDLHKRCEEAQARFEETWRTIHQQAVVLGVEFTEEPTYIFEVTAALSRAMDPFKDRLIELTGECSRCGAPKTAQRRSGLDG